MRNQGTSDITWYLLCGIAVGAFAVFAGRTFLSARRNRDDGRDEDEQEIIDEALEESFPASDPPAFSGAEHWT